MNESINIKQQENKIILSGEGFELMKKLENYNTELNARIKKNNEFVYGGGKLSEKKKEALEKMEDDYALLKNIHDRFNSIITEHSLLLYYLQLIAIDFKAIFPIEVKKTIMPSQAKKLEEVRQIFLSVSELFNQYNTS